MIGGFCVRGGGHGGPNGIWVLCRLSVRACRRGVAGRGRASRPDPRNSRAGFDGPPSLHLNLQLRG